MRPGLVESDGVDGDGVGQQVRCPLCGLEPDDSSRCPDCGQDLAPLVHVAALPALHYNRALEQAAAGDDDGAVGSLQRALVEDEHFVEAWTVLGKIHARNGRGGQARSAWKRALDMTPGHRAAQDALAALDAVEASRADEDAAAAAAATAQTQADQRVRRRDRRWKVALGSLGAGLLVVSLLLALLVARPARPPDGPPPPPPPPPAPASLTVAARGNDLILAGTVRDTVTRQAYSAAASSAAGNRRLVEAVVVDAEAARAPDLDPGDVAAVVGVLAAAPPGDRMVVLDGSGIVLSGTVPDGDAHRALVDGLRQSPAGPEVDDRIVVDPAGAAADLERVNRTLTDIQAASPILFRPPDGTISDQGRATVALVAEYLRQEPAFRVRIEGHAAATSGGDPAAATTVSQARAGVVRDLLAAAGVEPSRLDVQGLGDRFPLGTQSASRRVVIRVEG